MKNFLIMLYNIICIPALIVHEFLHMIFTLIVGASFRGFDIQKMENFNKNISIQVMVTTLSKYRWQNNIIHLSPLLSFAFWLIPLFFGYEYTSYILLFYTILCYKVLAPSKEDCEAIKNFISEKEVLNSL